MHCDQAHELLNIVCDGERLPNWHLALSLERHCITCASCRAYRQRLKRLRHTARHLPSEVAPQHLRSRVLTSLPASPPPSIVPAKKGSRKMTLRLVGSGLVLTAALAMGLLIVPRSHHTNTSLAGEDIRTALAHVNTWHLHGWKLKNGKQVPWDIWGRHTPFFYREQVGEEMTLDDGQQRIQVLGQESSAHNSRGIVLKMDSRPGPENAGWTFTALAKWHGIPRTAAKTTDTVTYILAESESMGPQPERQRDLLTMDLSTALPMHYDQQITRYRNQEILSRASDAPDDPKLIEKTWTGAHLDMEYEVALPATVEAEAWSPADRVVDMRSTVPHTNVPMENTAAKAGLTVQAQPVAMDAQGNVVVRIVGWLGNTPLDDKLTPLMFGAMPQSPAHEGSVGGYVNFTSGYNPIFARDEQGAGYTIVGQTALPVLSMNQTFMLLTPLEPSRLLPHTLTLRLTSGVTQMWIDEKGYAHSSPPIVSEDMTIGMQLPKQTHTIDQAALTKQYIHESASNSGEPLDRVCAEARATTYMETTDKRSAARWWQKAISLSRRVSDAQRYRGNLAVTYYMMGDKARAVQLLHEEIAVAERDPQEGDFYKKGAEDTLKRWNPH